MGCAEQPAQRWQFPSHWREAFDDARQRVHRALAQRDTERVLYEVFVRLYTLRNQLMHGGATWNSSVNRAQVRDGRALLARVLPVMMDHPERFEGKPFYPVVKEGPDVCAAIVGAAGAVIIVL